jgi:hypothetical protein
MRVIVACLLVGWVLGVISAGSLPLYERTAMTTAYGDDRAISQLLDAFFTLGGWDVERVDIVSNQHSMYVMRRSGLRLFSDPVGGAPKQLTWFGFGLMVFAFIALVASVVALTRWAAGRLVAARHVKQPAEQS